MHLKSLEIMGFKSFGRKTVFDFQPGLTAIIGPNGSGKSNIVDAIKWVLGEQSKKALRGKISSDIIFHGSKDKDGSSYALVSLTFDNSDLNNSKSSSVIIFVIIIAIIIFIYYNRTITTCP